MREKLILQNNLKETRISHGYSQEKLAELVGTTRQTIIAIEKQIFNPTAKLALLLCIALDCKFEDLFYF
ncbi:MAG: helix-turn-helix transcriptional regulator [Anaeroplasmataceae bacterium]|nr:helix-turn-helix transcriptional regulator [Anaeroplasmataceae bacterium]MDE6414397.1 helix-turn-helix transcriptional regulator [Anaeroplasmataceae bacterium]